MADPDDFQPWFLTVQRLKHGGFTVADGENSDSNVLAGFDTIDGVLSYVRKAMEPTTEPERRDDERDLVALQRHLVKDALNTTWRV